MYFVLFSAIREQSRNFEMPAAALIFCRKYCRLVINTNIDIVMLPNTPCNKGYSKQVLPYTTDLPLTLPEFHYT